MLSDVAHGGGELRIGRGDGVGGLTGDDTQRRDPQRLAAHALAAHHAVQQARGFIAGLPRIGHHAGERRLAEGTQQFVIVLTDHRHLIRHLHAELAAHIQHMLATDVIARHDAHGLGQRGDPACQLAALAVPVQGIAGLRIKHITRMSRALQCRHKMPRVITRPREAAVPAETEVADAALHWRA